MADSLCSDPHRLPHRKSRHETLPDQSRRTGYSADARPARPGRGTSACLTVTLRHQRRYSTCVASGIVVTTSICRHRGNTSPLPYVPKMSHDIAHGTVIREIAAPHGGISSKESLPSRTYRRLCRDDAIDKYRHTRAITGSSHLSAQATATARQLPSPSRTWPVPSGQVVDGNVRALTTSRFACQAGNESGTTG